MCSGSDAAAEEPSLLQDPGHQDDDRSWEHPEEARRRSGSQGGAPFLFCWNVTSNTGCRGYRLVAVCRQVVSSNETQAQEDDPHTVRFQFEPSLYQCFENCGSLKLTVSRHGGDAGVTAKVEEPPVRLCSHPSRLGQSSTWRQPEGLHSPTETFPSPILVSAQRKQMSLCRGSLIFAAKLASISENDSFSALPCRHGDIEPARHAATSLLFLGSDAVYSFPPGFVTPSGTFVSLTRSFGLMLAFCSS